jgi:hypothetical protein
MSDEALDTGNADGADAAAVAAAAATAAAEAAKDGADKTGDQGAAPKWLDNWREEAAGEDAASRKILDRYTGPLDAIKALPEARRKISEMGEPTVLQMPAGDASDEDKQSWRDAMGIPEKHDGYELTLSEGRTLGDDDRVVYDGFTPVAHELGLTPAQVSGVTDWFLNTQEVNTGDLMTIDEEFRGKGVDALKEELTAGELKINMAGLDRVLFARAKEPAELRELIFGARDSDGMRIGNNPAVLKFLFDIQNDLMPSHRVLPDDDDSNKGLENELDDIKKAMQTDGGREYWGDPKMQARHIELTAAQLRIQARNKGA